MSLLRAVDEYITRNLNYLEYCLVLVDYNRNESYNAFHFLIVFYVNISEQFNKNAIRF